MYGIAKRKTKRVLLFDKHLIVQAVLWVGEFLFQMLAMQHIRLVSSGQTYVKTITMLNIVITTAISSMIFREKDRARRIVSSILIFIGAAIVVLFR
jgi:drug/metabolite transporter (DMT)-like permease